MEEKDQWEGAGWEDGARVKVQKEEKDFKFVLCILYAWCCTPLSNTVKCPTSQWNGALNPNAKEEIKRKEKTSIQQMTENIHIFQYKSVFGQTSCVGGRV